jgi:hypothetical protein
LVETKNGLVARFDHIESGVSVLRDCPIRGVFVVYWDENDKLSQ